MKRLILLGIVLFLCLPVAVYAASIGGAETQEKGKLAIGLDQEFVFDRDMKYIKGIENVQSAAVEIDSMYRTLAKISYGLLDNFDVYVKLGTADAKVKGPITTVAEGERIYSAKTDNAFAWGLGAKATYEFAKDWFLGADTQYLTHKHNGHSSSGPSNWNADYTFQEWQVAPYIAKRLGNFVPYGGVKYSDLRMKDKDKNGSTTKYKADDNFGVFLGTDYKIGKNFSLNIEGRFVDETAMSFGASYRF